MLGDLCKGGEERDNIIVEFGCLSCVEVREPSQIVDEMIDHDSSLISHEEVDAEARGENAALEAASAKL
jgi:hypothetical protein